MYDIKGISIELLENRFIVKEYFDDVCGKQSTGKLDTICIIATPQ